MSSSERKPASSRDRLPPIPEDELSAEQRAAVGELLSGPRSAFGGPFVPLLRSPEFMTRVQKVGEYLRFGSILSRHIIEFVTIYTARQWTQRYEWYAHLPLALKAGVTRSVAEAIAEGRRPDGMNEDEAAAYAICDELERTKAVSDATYRRAVERFGEQGVVEIVGLTGYYGMLARVMNMGRTAVPGDVEVPLPSLPG
jgi:4-carboxymuconolactone decarboxylase